MLDGEGLLGGRARHLRLVSALGQARKRNKRLFRIGVWQNKGPIMPFERSRSRSSLAAVLPGRRGSGASLGSRDSMLPPPF
jgi:hypothetical protein